LDGIIDRLAGVSESAALDAQVLLAHVLGRSRSWVLAHPEVEWTLEQSSALEEGVARLQSGEPLPYVIGHWEFYGADFIVTPAVLIPRPETELLVETALAWLRAHPARRLAADVGTGSGCIAISLTRHMADLRVLASDISLPALSVAWQNALRSGVGGRVHCLQADLLPPAGRPFDLVCANLPYIPTASLADLRVAQWEPRLALDGGADGLIWIERLLAVLRRGLEPQGLALLEIEASQGAAAAGLAQRAFPRAKVDVLVDLAGHDRLVRIQN
jgi:release factor glutamine methyltransferase